MHDIFNNLVPMVTILTSKNGTNLLVAMKESSEIMSDADEERNLAVTEKTFWSFLKAALRKVRRTASTFSMIIREVFVQNLETFYSRRLGEYL